MFRQIELNWINAPLDDQNDYLALYLDGNPNDDLQMPPVSVHTLNGRMSGKLTTNYYLPMIDFMNETRFSTRTQPVDEPLDIQYDIEGPLESNEPFHGLSGGRWHRHNTYATQRRHDHPYQQQRRRQIESPTPRATLGDDQCIGYCVAYHSQSRILATNCLKSHPNWMRETQSTMRSLPSLMIPGTHNSATYPRQLDRTVLQIINKYQINQDESIFNQLVYGIRYLDLRVGHSKVKQRPEELWIYHDIFRTDVSVDEVFDQVARFLELTTHEIIVMDFHRFTVGFQGENIQTQRERHAKLIQLLFKRLGQYIVPSYLGQHAPLNEYISMGKRLIVGYASRSQLLGALADYPTGMFGLLSAEASKKSQQLRSSESYESFDNSNSSDHNENQQADAQPTDRRMGTRIYNKLKSLKLISRQFSKRSLDLKEKGAGGKSKKLFVSNNLMQHSNQLRPTGELDGEAAAGQLVDGSDEGTGSPEEAMASLTSRLALLFPPVRHLWPNKDTVEGLAQYMNETTCRKYFNELRSMMVELTPTVFGAISDKYDGNRRLADSANRPVTDWIRQRWLHCMNIVASDFFLGNDIIRLSIYANRKRLNNNHRRGHADDLSSYGSQCKSFRRIEHLLDKTRIVGTSEYYSHHHDNNSKQLQPASGNAHQPANPDGLTDLFSVFRRIFNL